MPIRGPDCVPFDKHLVVAAITELVVRRAAIDERI
jgi:hypothetical protein